MQGGGKEVVLFYAWRTRPHSNWIACATRQKFFGSFFQKRTTSFLRPLIRSLRIARRKPSLLAAPIPAHPGHAGSGQVRGALVAVPIHDVAAHDDHRRPGGRPLEDLRASRNVIGRGRIEPAAGDRMRQRHRVAAQIDELRRRVAAEQIAHFGRQDRLGAGNARRRGLEGAMRRVCRQRRNAQVRILRDGNRVRQAGCHQGLHERGEARRCRLFPGER